MENIEYAQLFYRVADILEIVGENPYKVRAYQGAAQTIEGLSARLDEVAEKEGEKGLRAIPGIGESIARKILEVYQTGRLVFLDELQTRVPTSMLELLQVRDIGARTIQKLSQKLGIASVEELERAARDHRIREIEGFGQRSEENILRNIALFRENKGLLLLGRVLPVAEHILEELKRAPVGRISLAGSLRRMKETVGDIDILATSKRPETVFQSFTSLPVVGEVTERGETKSSVLLRTGIQCDLRVVEEKSFGAALQYFTGSKAHNIRTRRLGVEKGLRLNEYGVFSAEGEKYLGGKTEEEVYQLLGLRYIEPEMREDRGEIEAARSGKLPGLVRLSDIKGDLQVHTTSSDGKNTIEEMVEAARQLGYQYLGVTDHSPAVGVAGGQSAEELLAQVARIRKLNEKLTDFYVLAGSEVDIRSDGNLDYPDRVLAELDFVLVSVHSGFKSPRAEMTKRIVRALKNPRTTILGHPTGRRLGERAPYEVDMEEVMKVAREENVILEINAYWDRLDLNDVMARMAVEKGCRIAINTDAHRVSHLEMMRFGVATARRGWVEKKSVVNTSTLARLKKAGGKFILHH